MYDLWAFTVIFLKTVWVNINNIHLFLHKIYLCENLCAIPHRASHFYSYLKFICIQPQLEDLFH